MTAPQQFSPDGQWWWDGTQWVPAQQAPVPAPQYYPPYGMPPQQAGGSDGKAVASLVLSILWIAGLGSLIAVILGHQSRSGARKKNRQPSGLALAGLIIGYIGLAGATVLLILGVAVGGQISHAIRVEDTLNSVPGAESRYHVQHGQYTGDLDVLQQYGYQPRNGVIVTVVRATPTSYCFSSPTAFGEYEYISDNRAIASSDPCG